MCTNRGASFPKSLDNSFIRKLLHDMDIYEILVTQGGRKLMPNTRLNSSMISFISPSPTGNENKIEGIEVFAHRKKF